MISQPPLNPDALEEAAKELFLEDESTAYVKYPEWDSPENLGKPVYIENARAAVSAYLASAEPELAARLDQAEQAVERVREALSEVQTRGEKIRAKGNNGSIYQQERAARGEGYLEATRLAFRALDGDPRAEV